MSRDVSDKLTTIAVGGRGAGQVLTGNYGMAAFHVRQPLNFDYGAEIPDEILTIDRDIYREMVLAYRLPNGSTEKFRFWAHVDSIKDEVALLKELSSGYRPVFQNNTKL